jgi:hypothetical protein
MRNLLAPTSRPAPVDGHVCVIDIGSPASLGWAIEGPTPRSGSQLEDCIEAVADALATGPVALGFEAPLIVPFRNDTRSYNRARAGECVPGRASRPFCLGPGAYVTTMATVVVPLVLQHLYRLAPDISFTLDWTTPPRAPGQLLFFEAFVSDQPKGRPDPHVADARLAARHLLAQFQEGRVETALGDEPWLNLLGAALLRAGWTTDLTVLAAPVLVVRP